MEIDEGFSIFVVKNDAASNDVSIKNTVIPFHSISLNP